MLYTRREVGKLALASVPAARMFGAAKINSKFGGVQIGVITYSLRSIASPDPEAIIKACIEVGLGEVELMSNHCEALAGAPSSGGGAGGGGGAGRERFVGRVAPQEQCPACRVPEGAADRAADAR